MVRHQKKMAPWLLGLIIAVLVFAAVLVLFSVLGFGDDPVVDSLGALVG